jgi:hypothetical protein
LLSCGERTTVHLDRVKTALRPFHGYNVCARAAHPCILCNNQQTTGLIQKDRSQTSSKLKHVDIHSLWLRQVYRDGLITVQWVPTTGMPSDGFTKSRSAEKHAQFVRHLGLVVISSQIDPQHQCEEANSDNAQTSSETE